MSVTEISIIHHVGIVLLLLWLLNSFNCCHPIIYLLSLIYFYKVHERYALRLRRKLQFEEAKAANQRRILRDSETVRWLNHAVEKLWPIFMEQMISQRIFLPIIPWFLNKYKPWAVKRAVVQNLYLGRSPPLFTDIRVLRGSADDDHLVLELGLSFSTADDMSAILSAKMRKRLGFGITTKLHLTEMHVEGKVLVGVKFLRSWPFISRLRLCFCEPPYFQMTVKPIFNHGLDVTELPGIAGWLDKLLAIAFEETLVEPNMLVIDLEKFVSPKPENWFSVDVKEPVSSADVEIIEAAELKRLDLNGLADPYVKGHLGPYKFKTQTQKKTSTPKWLEEFEIPIFSWDIQNVLTIKVRDKDRFVDDVLGYCSIKISNLRDGQRHDMWLPLENAKTGSLHLAITISEANRKESRQGIEKTGEEVKTEGQKPDSLQTVSPKQGLISSSLLKNVEKFPDTLEAIDVEGKEKGKWFRHPGSEISQAWEPRKGKNGHVDTKIPSLNLPKSSSENGSSSEDENKEGHRVKRGNIIRRGFRRIFRKHPRRENHLMQAFPSKGFSRLVATSEEGVPLESDSSSDEDSLSSSLYDQPMAGIEVASSFISRSIDAKAEPKELVNLEAALTDTVNDVTEGLTTMASIEVGESFKPNSLEEGGEEK